MSDLLKILCGDALEQLRTLPDESVQCCVTSPPYWGLRDYGNAGQLGLEKRPEEYVAKMVAVFRELRRVLKDDGTLWLNLGDSYCAGGGDRKNGSQGKNSIVGHTSPESNPDRRNRPREIGLKPKDLVGIPWMVAFALRADGWWLRQDIIWSKPNPMPESVTDRCTKAHEYIFLLSKREKYNFDCDAIAEPSVYFGNDARSGQGNIRYEGKRIIDTTGANGQDSFVTINETRNKRSVWTVTTNPYPDAHFATYPPDLIKPCILAGSKSGDTILDPFAGSGTTGMVALELGRKAVLIELNPEYVKLIEKRCDVTPGLALT